VLEKKHKLNLETTKLVAKQPDLLVKKASSQVNELERSLINEIEKKITQFKQQFATQLATLHAVSPLATLDRGYAIVSHHQKVLFDAQQVNTGDLIDVRLATGKLKASVV